MIWYCKYVTLPNWSINSNDPDHLIKGSSYVCRNWQTDPKIRPKCKRPKITKSILKKKINARDVKLSRLNNMTLKVGVVFTQR